MELAKADDEDQLGSNSWLGASEYDSGHELHERATSFYKNVKWDGMTSHASKLRNGIICEFTDRFSVGYFNMVRRIVFGDGINWVARLRMPPANGEEETDHYSSLTAEIASMAFLRWG